MLEPRSLISFVSKQDDPILRYPSLLRSFHRDFQEGFLCTQCLGSRVFQLEGKLLDRVSWICWRDYPTSPEASIYGGREVDRIGCEKTNDIAFFPFPGGFEALAKGDGCGLHLLVGIGP